MKKTITIFFVCIMMLASVFAVQAQEKEEGMMEDPYDPDMMPPEYYDEGYDEDKEGYEGEDQEQYPMMYNEKYEEGKEYEEEKEEYEYDQKDDADDSDEESKDESEEYDKEEKEKGSEQAIMMSQGMPACEEKVRVLEQHIADLEKYIEDKGLELPEASEEEQALAEELKEAEE